MQINRIKTKGNALVLLLAAIVIITALAVMFQPKEDILPVYDGSEQPSQVSTETSKIDIETFDYVDEETGFTMPIPNGWTKVTKSGNPTYIHNPTATSLQIARSDYNPRINNDSIDSLSQSIQNSGYAIGEIQFFSSSSYYYSYYKQNNAGGYVAYCSFVMWDLQYIYSVNAVINEEYYQKMLPYVQNSLTHIKWETNTNIPNELNITYVEFGNFSFAYPVNWSIGTTESAIVVSDNNTGSTITVRSTQNAADYSKISQVQYNQYISNGRQNFIMKQYANDGNVIHGEAIYYVNGTQYGIYQYLISTGTFEIEITLDCPMNAVNQVLPLFQTSMKYFHIHDNDEQNKKKPIENSQSSNVGDVSHQHSEQSESSVNNSTAFIEESSQSESTQTEELSKTESSSMFS